MHSYKTDKKKNWFYTFADCFKVCCGLCIEAHGRLERESNLSVNVVHFSPASLFLDLLPAPDTPFHDPLPTPDTPFHDPFPPTDSPFLDPLPPPDTPFLDPLPPPDTQQPYVEH